MPDLVVIFRTQSDIEASIVRGLLETHGIASLLASDVPHSILPLSVDGLGEVRLSVRAADAEEAQRVIATHSGERGGELDRDAGAKLESLEARLDHRFEDRGLLEQALTHRSRAHETAPAVEDNESLEFLGDAVVGLVVADLLCREWPDSSEGEKSKVKAALVSTTSLAELGGQLDLGAYLRLGRGEEKTGGRSKPALLADAVEAVVAAIYLDGGLEAAGSFLRRHLRGRVDEAWATGFDTFVADYKSELQEWVQAHDMPLPAYRVVAQTGPDHQKVFQVEVLVEKRPVARADGRSKKEAEQQAARLALACLRTDLA